jgi:hypothetical protein
LERELIEQLEMKEIHQKIVASKQKMQDAKSMMIRHEIEANLS